jgi:hypothetical protein
MCGADGVDGRDGGCGPGDGASGERTRVLSRAGRGVDVQRAGAERRGRAARPGRPGPPRGEAGHEHRRLGCKANRSGYLTRSAAARNGRQPRNRVGCQPSLHHAQRRHVCEGDQRLGAAEPNCLSAVTLRNEQ